VGALLSAAMALLAWLTSKENAKKLQNVYVTVNSRLDELLRSQREVGRLAGVEEGRLKQQAENGIKAEAAKAALEGPKKESLP
jgi:hypothetical protein